MPNKVEVRSGRDEAGVGTCGRKRKRERQLHRWENSAFVTEVLRVDAARPDHSPIARAAECLRGGGLVAFPTETVYGLGAHALDRTAIRRVFEAKGRPPNDPLIVHVTSIEGAEPLVTVTSATARALAQRFWPGPLTMVLPRSTVVPDEVTAGLSTVAIRVPSHPVARALLEQSGLPIAAPSANLFSRPSPTSATHVLADLEGRVDIILDGGSTHVGLESTVLDLSGDVPTVLRPGAIDIAVLRELLPEVIARYAAARDDVAMPSPGMLTRHYSPRTAVRLFEGARETALRLMHAEAVERLEGGEAVAVLAYEEDMVEWRSLPVRIVPLGSENNAATIAARLYAALRECDELGASIILVRALNATHPLSGAIRDRLRRAAAS